MTNPSVLRSKLFWVGVLYFAEGFPLGIFYEILPVYFRQSGVDLGDIGFLSLLGLAWSIKFLWAPAIDRYRHHRTWMLMVDLAMAAVLLIVALKSGFGDWVWVAFGIFTLLSATNDIAIDGYTIEFLNKEEYGVANGVRIGLYRVGLIATGGLLVLQPLIGWNGVFMAAAAVMVVMGIFCRSAPPELPGGGRTKVAASDEILRLIREPLVFLPALTLIGALLMALLKLWWIALAMTVATVVLAFWNRHRGVDMSQFARGPVFGTFLSMASRRYFFPVILFILAFKLADQTIGFMIKPFWVDAGFSAAQIGTVSVNIGIALSIAGGLVGGWFTDRHGVFTGLWVMGLTQIISNLGYAGLATILPLPMTEIDHPTSHLVMMYSASAVESFTQGLGTGAFMAFLMTIVHKANAATEFAVLSSVFVLARSVAGWVGGIGAEALGYSTFFFITVACGLPAYLLLPYVKGMLRDVALRDQPNSDDVEATGSKSA